MIDVLVQLALFGAKLVILLIFFFLLLIGILAIFAKTKQQQNKGLLRVKTLNDQYTNAALTILSETATKKELKVYLKHKKEQEKAQDKLATSPKCLYVLNFNGDIKASAVTALSHEINAILSVARSQDEVVLKLESPGGVVHGYGLAAAQLMRIRDKGIHLTIIIDKVAASGGYMMASIANKILAAPFAIIGSIGVIVQLPNFNRLLKNKNIDFEQQTAGEYKRTLTVFGENTDEGRLKMREELEHIHHQFKELITTYRKLDLNKVATGEHWLGKEALTLNLVDGLTTSDAYLLEQSQHAKLVEVCYEMKKTFLSRLTAGSTALLQQTLERCLIR